MDNKKLSELKVFAAKLRIDVLEMLIKCGSGHLGGSLSLAELMSVLYCKQMKIDPENPRWEERDRLVLSKGHCGPVLYSSLAEKGFFPKDMLFTLNVGGTNLPSHPDRTKTPGVDMTTGSLGQGTSTATGIALGLKMKNNPANVYMIVGDGELNEGQCWEAFQFLAHNKLNNCIVIIDDNKRQLDGFTKDIMNPFSIADKMKAFGFHVQTVKGDDMEAIDEAIDVAKSVKDQAVCIVLDTIKGQGIKYFEDMVSNHSVKFAGTEKEEALKAIDELKAFVEQEERNV